ncbi:MAG: ATP-binding protein, partial [Halodesulfurarchaeum sp.]|nr:ATP-binding protein [Halodesulfurarchaeum sp.]
KVTGDKTFEADPDRLASLLENLFRNAVEHAGPEVTVTVEPTSDGFAVADDGPGIPPEDRETVFESGYTTETDGTGFGLAIVAEVATAHDWSVRVEESDAGGARFVFAGQ